MRRVVAAINMTIDGFCDHTAIIPDEELHQHYTELLGSADAIIYGRITYQLMENYWPGVVNNPTGNKPIDEFAVTMQNIQKIVFSRTLKDVEWENAKLARRGISEEILDLRQQPGRDILAGSPGLILALMKLDLVDEYQLCVHPVVAGGGLPLFKEIKKRIVLKLTKTKILGSGAIILYYEPDRSPEHALN